MKLKRRPNRAMPDNTVPLINIVFLMLIFFLVAGTVTRDDAKTIDAPFNMADDERIRSTGALVIDHAGNLFLEGKEISLDDARTRLLGEPGNEQVDGGKLLLAADARLPASELKRVLRGLAKNNGRTIVLITRRSSQ